MDRITRRQYLGALGGSTLAALAGCTDSASSTTTPDSSHPTATEFERMRIEFSQWYAREAIQYYDEASDSLRLVEPENDWWVEIAVRFQHLGNGTATIPPLDSITLQSGGTMQSAMLSPPGVDKTSLRIRPRDAYFLRPDWQSESLDEGRRALEYALYDAPADRHPILRITSSEGTIQLSPAFGYTPDGQSLTYN